MNKNSTSGIFLLLGRDALLLASFFYIVISALGCKPNPFQDPPLEDIYRSSAAVFMARFDPHTRLHEIIEVYKSEGRYEEEIFIGARMQLVPVGQIETTTEMLIFVAHYDDEFGMDPFYYRRSVKIENGLFIWKDQTRMVTEVRDMGGG